MSNQSNQGQDRQDKNRQQRGIFTLAGIGVAVHPDELSNVVVVRRDGQDPFVKGLTIANGTVPMLDYRKATVKVVEQIVAKRAELAGFTEDPRLKTLREAKQKLDDLNASGITVSSADVEDQIAAIQEGMAEAVRNLEQAIAALEKELVEVWYNHASINVVPGDRNSFVIQFGDTDFNRPNMVLKSDCISLPQGEIRYDLVSASKKEVQGGGKAHGFVRELIDRDGNVQVIFCSSQDMTIGHAFQASAGEFAGGFHVTIEITNNKLAFYAIPYVMDLANAFGTLKRQGAMAEQFMAAAKRQAAKVVAEETEVPVEPPATATTTSRRGKKSDGKKEAASS
ncbi:MAG: hypothetical protein HUU49_02330 [Candidatus Buchananbacteria bacterium]|nr:hypothetical protein [Candidatus Buchananbacteria bacterium]